ncbi:MAG: MFS transporter [Alphaproteobacteria bacterium]|nr:MFS transporter [Alphaproteobacteria bacterium]MBU1513265.1 MFS transporter [Alphaproteobacteria bacterium]MBU2093615.1 MFS transporter [Alphaproteobacteria bacterium]MBU2151941.1 MFS transporter [Alphaproteobacteria bacterium]MBU2307601.1 MFS transporter [Alphaproteobacteria bacterium]
MTTAERTRLLAYGAVTLVLVQFAVPYEGLIGLPVVFFLKNKLGLSAHGVATFNLIASIPLFVGFLFGFLRDTWSPFRRGDRAHVVLFGLLTAAAYGLMILLQPTYGLLLAGVFMTTVAIQMVLSAGRGATAAIGQDEAMTGQVSVMGNLVIMIPNMVAYFLGGALSGYLEGRDAVGAARILFGVGAGLMLVVAVLGALGPRRLFDSHHQTAREHDAAGDFARLLRHRPLYAIMAIQLLWQFAPATGPVLQFHLSNDLHATDAQVGAWYAIFMGAFAPMMLAYAWLCRRVRLNTLLWVGTTMAVVQMVPLLFVRTPTEALFAAALLGLIGGLGQAAFTDLAIRACPRGLQGTMMMMFIAMYYVSLRFGDVFGAWLYDQKGGFQTAIYATVVIYALILPMLLLVPGNLKTTLDGETLPA